MTAQVWKDSKNLGEQKHLIASPHPAPHKGISTFKILQSHNSSQYKLKDLIYAATEAEDRSGRENINKSNKYETSIHL